MQKSRKHMIDKLKNCELMSCIIILVPACAACTQAGLSVLVAELQNLAN